MRNSLISIIIVLIAFPVPNFAQAEFEKDQKIYAELELEIRKDLDKEIARFKPLPSPVPARVPPAALQSSYDKFKDLTVVTIETPIYHAITPPTTPPVGGLGKGGCCVSDVDLILAYTYPGQQPIKPTSINLVFRVLARGPLFGENQSFIVIADDKRYRLGNLIQTIETTSSRLVLEFNSIIIPHDTFVEIANADDVEVQVGNVDFPFSDLHLKAFRMITGLPDKARKQAVETSDSINNKLSNSDESALRIENTAWKGKHELVLEFKPDGTLSLLGGGLGNRAGIWRQEGDKVQIELPAIGVGWGSRLIATGIIKIDKMVIIFKARGGIYSGTTKAVLQQSPLYRR